MADDTLFQRLKNTLKRGTAVGGLVQLADYPTEKVKEPLERFMTDVSVKHTRRRRMNRHYKHTVILENGLLELHNRKNLAKDQLMKLEFRLNLDKATLLSDDRSVIIRFPNESFVLTPLDIPGVDLKYHIHQHRLYCQETKEAKEKKSDVSVNNTTGGVITSASSMGSVDSNDSIALMQLMEAMYEQQTATMNIMEMATKQLAEMKELLKEMRLLKAKFMERASPKITKKRMERVPEETPTGRPNTSKRVSDMSSSGGSDKSNRLRSEESAKNPQRSPKEAIAGTSV